ncbi:MAG: AbrB/MazE/SpoVT family DNA-binding domain-containing protein [Rhizorhabdus sp.]|nr:AbrB/MazE/SpoVT family DNA-binding domain-containing protein [Rhizorhabdus sp.]
MNVQRGRLVSGGRLQVPAEIRRVLGLADGDQVLLRVVDGELHVRPVHSALGRVQARLRAHLPAGSSLSDELIEDRRRASEHE